MCVPFQYLIFGSETTWERAPCDLGDLSLWRIQQLGRRAGIFLFTAQYFSIINWVDCLDLRNEFQVNHTLDIRGSAVTYCSRRSVLLPAEAFELRKRLMTLPKATVR